MKKILVVDDQESILGIFESMASMLEAEIITEMSGLKALELIKTETFDLYFMDVMMPEINGIDLATQLFEKLSNPKIVLMSGTVSQSEIPKEVRSKIQFLPKPFNIKQIREFIKNV